MPIPFRYQDDSEELGLAAFLLIEAEAARGGWRGALFQVNARGEPVEFTYNRVGTPNGFLWRAADLRRAAAKTLASSLLATCSQTPHLIVAPAKRVASELFCHDVRVATAVCRVATGDQAAAYSPLETPETWPPGQATAEPQHLFWFPSPPGEGSPARRLVRTLGQRGLLVEPFERAAVGLREVFGDSAGEPA